jgi:hypothetical protein
LCVAVLVFNQIDQCLNAEVNVNRPIELINGEAAWQFPPSALSFEQIYLRYSKQQ